MTLSPPQVLVAAGAIAAWLTGAVAVGGTFHVSPHGDDAADGSAAAPFRTVQRGAEAARPGDTVLVAPGIYRERVAPPRGGTEGAAITFRSAEPHRAMIRGSEAWKPQWRRERDGVWSGALDPGLFTDTEHVDGANPFEIPLAATPWGREGRPEHERHVKGERGGSPRADPGLVYSLGQVFVDGRLLIQAARRAEMDREPGSWWYDRDERRLWVHFPAGGPADHEVEITTRRRIFAPHERGLGHIVIEGFVFEHCGNQYPADFWMREKPRNQQAGAVGTRSGHHWTIRGNVIRLAGSVGLDLGLEGHADTDLEQGGRRRPAAAGHHVVEDNWILDNGCAGTASYLGTDLVLRRNVVAGNNALRFRGAKRWENGGIKLHAPSRSLIEGNLVAGNPDRWGIWLDQGPGMGTRIVGNLVVGHGVGIDLELGRDADAIVAANVLIDNDVGISFREAGGTDLVHNLVLGSGRAGIEVTADAGREGAWSAERIGMFNGIVSARDLLVAVTRLDAADGGGRRFAGNLYAADATDEKWAVRAGGRRPGTLAAWQDAWREVNGGRDDDGDSVAEPGLAHDYDPGTTELVLRIPGAASLPRCRPDDRVPNDYFGRPYPGGEATVPGPFAGLRPGENRFVLWPRARPPAAATADPPPRGE